MGSNLLGCFITVILRSGQKVLCNPLGAWFCGLPSLAVKKSLLGSYEAVMKQYGAKSKSM